jgi:hypothetical protein
MTRGVATTVVSCVATCILMCAPAARATAQGTPSVQVIGPSSNPITDAVGTFTIVATNFAAADLPLRLNLQVASTSSFDGPLFADTIVNGSSATITIPRLLPSTGQLFWRAFALTARAGSVPSPVTGPRAAPVHLVLVSPNKAAGQSLQTRQPTFVWKSSRVPPSLGIWDYELRVEETATGRAVLTVTTTDTTHTAIDGALESNASYRWRVTARLRAIDDSVTVSSLASFVILSGDAPLTTLLHNPFPSPFPSLNSNSVCIWFDLSVAGSVAVDIIDSRGLTVRRLMPSDALGTSLPAGRYGRPSPDATTGCDERFAWDGTDATGRRAPNGRYLVRLSAGGRVQYKGIVLQRR